MTADPEAPSASHPSLRLGASSHAGALPTNEDACATVETPVASVVVVADGAGGHAGGEIASDIVVRSVKTFFEREGAFEPGKDVVRRALDAAQRALREAIESSPRERDMRSTALVVVATPTTAWVGHVGDSRAYLVRGAEVKQLTRDDTLVQALVDSGEIDQEKARTHSKANVLLQAMGDPRELEYHVSDAIPMRPDDVLIACSDGLTEVLADGEIARLVRGGASAERAERLVAQAVAAGAQDNVTAAVVVWRPRSDRRAISMATRAVSPQKKPGRGAQRSRDRFGAAALAAVVLAALALALAVRHRRKRDEQLRLQRHQHEPQRQHPRGAARPPAAGAARA